MPAGRGTTQTHMHDALPLIHSSIAWCEQQWPGIPYSLTVWRAAAQRTDEWVYPNEPAFYGWGLLTPGTELCPGYRAGTSFLTDRPSSAYPQWRWTFDAVSPTGESWTC